MSARIVNLELGTEGLATVDALLKDILARLSGLPRNVRHRALGHIHRLLAGEAIAMRIAAAPVSTPEAYRLTCEVFVWEAERICAAAFGAMEIEDSMEAGDEGAR